MAARQDLQNQRDSAKSLKEVKLAEQVAKEHERRHAADRRAKLAEEQRHRQQTAFQAWRSYFERRKEVRREKQNRGFRSRPHDFFKMPGSSKQQRSKHSTRSHKRAVEAVRAMTVDEQMAAWRAEWGQWVDALPSTEMPPFPKPSAFSAYLQDLNWGTQDSVNKTYRQLMAEWHPDKLRQRLADKLGDAQREVLEARFDEIAKEINSVFDR